MKNIFKHRRSSTQEDEFEALYQNVLKKKEHALFLRETVQRNSNEKPQEKIIEIMNKARKVAILNSLSIDELSVTTSVPIKNVIASLNSKPTYFFSFLAEPLLGQNVSQYIKMIYKNPEQFADAFIEYFSTDSSQKTLFISLLFPAICGYFVGEEHLTFAYQVLNYLVQMGHYVFAKPLFLSFYMSSLLFIDTFWDHFFTEVDHLKNKPSMKDLYNIILDTLKSTVRYLSPLHTALSMDLLTTNIDLFIEVFFIKFLFNSFQIYANENPTLKNMKVGKTQILRIVNFFSNNVDSDAFDAVREAFMQGVSSLCEPSCIVDYTPKGAIPFVFSPLEAVLLIKIVKKMPASSGKSTDLNRIKNQQKLSSFMPCAVDAYFNTKKKGFSAVLFCDKIIDTPEPSKETSRNWLHLKKRCAFADADASKMIYECKLKDPQDTNEDQEIKKYIAKISTPEFKIYAMKQTLNELTESEQLFETCLVRLSQKGHLNELIDSLNRYEVVVTRYVNKKYTSLPPECPREFFTCAEAIDGLQIKEDEKLVSLIEKKKLFDTIVHKLTLKDNSYKSFIKKYDQIITKHSYVLDKLDEKSLGERMWVICDVVDMITQVIKKEEWLLPTFFHVLDKSKATSFFHTYLSINQYKSLQPNNFVKLPERLQQTWRRLSQQIDKLFKHKMTFPEEFVQEVMLFIK